MSGRKAIVRSHRRNALSSQLLLRRLQRFHGRVVYPMPAIILPNTVLENYKSAMALKERWFESKLARCRTKFQTITVVVCHEFDLTQEQLMNGGRYHAFPRQVAMHLVRTHTKQGLNPIGQLFNRDKTCISQAKSTVQKTAAGDVAFAEKLAAMSRIVQAA
jgi:hypothetical protein